jgi:hypothetical protein
MDVESGVGAVTGQGSNPQIFLDYSRHGGRTFINYQQFNSLGALGQYLNRVRWFNLGQAFQWTFRIHISDPVRRTIIHAHAQTSLGEP